MGFKDYELKELIGTIGGPGRCDAPANTAPSGDGRGECTCVVCGRCGKHTGNSNQGHYWSHCDVTGKLEDLHYCCPGSCSLQAEAAANRTI